VQGLPAGRRCAPQRTPRCAWRRRIARAWVRRRHKLAMVYNVADPQSKTWQTTRASPGDSDMRVTCATSGMLWSDISGYNTAPPPKTLTLPSPRRMQLARRMPFDNSCPAHTPASPWTWSSQIVLRTAPQVRDVRGPTSNTPPGGIHRRASKDVVRGHTAG